MRLAYTMSPGRGDTDLLLARFAAALSARGARPCGVVQINSERPGAQACDMDVRVLPDGPVLRISQSLGAGARGCRLDPAALERAVAEVERGLRAGPDLLVVNKFGKHEAEGRGFRTVIAEALCLGVPVLCGVNALNLPAFLAFCDGAGRALEPDLPQLIDWADRVSAAPARV